MDNLHKNPITSKLNLTNSMLSSNRNHLLQSNENNIFVDSEIQYTVFSKPNETFEINKPDDCNKNSLESPLSTTPQTIESQEICQLKETLKFRNSQSQATREESNQFISESQHIRGLPEARQQESERQSIRENTIEIQEREAVLLNEDEEENNDQHIDEHQMKELIKEMGKVKAEFYLRHSMAFFLACLFLARYSLELIENRSCLKEILIVLYGYLCYAFLEEIKFYFRVKTSDNDTKISYIYAGLDVFSLICSLILLHLKFLKVLPPGKIASLPGLVICALFYFSSYRRKSAKNLFLLKRFLEAVQIYLIEAKADGRLDLTWRSILVYTSIYIGVRILLLVASLKTVKVLLPHNVKKANILLSLWHCLYIALFIVMLVIYISYSQAVDTNGDYELLKACLTSAQYFSALLFCYTVFTKPFLLMAFSRASSLDYQSNEFGEIILDPLSIGISKKIKVEMLETYFSKISSTYYRHLEKPTIYVNKMKSSELELRIIYDRAKEITKELHCAYLNLAQSIKETSIIRGTVEKNQEPLQIKHSGSQNKNLRKKGNKSLILKKENICPSIFSMNKCDQSDIIQEENLCFVCLKEAANGVILECGHSGFCYECAEKYMLMKNQCMSCRGIAERIAKIITKPIFGKVFQSSKVGKLVWMVDDDRCQWIFD